MNRFVKSLAGFVLTVGLLVGVFLAGILAGFIVKLFMLGFNLSR